MESSPHDRLQIELSMKLSVHACALQNIANALAHFQMSLTVGAYMYAQAKAQCVPHTLAYLLAYISASDYILVGVLVGVSLTLILTFTHSFTNRALFSQRHML